MTSMRSIHNYFREEINKYGLEVNLLTDTEINDIFFRHIEHLVSLNPQYVLCKYIYYVDNKTHNIEFFFCSTYYEILDIYSETNDVALYYLAYAVSNITSADYLEENTQMEFINKKIHLLNPDKDARLFRIFGFLYLSEGLVMEAKKLFLLGVEKLDMESANELFDIYEQENDFEVTYNFCIKSINLGIDVYKKFFNFLYKSKRFDMLRKHYSEILLSGKYVDIGESALTEIFREYEKIINELTYRPGNQGFIEAKNHFKSLI